ncbi:MULTISPECIES: inositol monophosphatase family protein [Pseudophaeobacter]|uniref:inositol monophosphatase family protein n=1 Tax=Pseudophaeobacter TaxID=1541822 RepID=UPI00242F19DF|nr:3'(2'),5'-bisphosphate nucleotidase CysQ [Pseudophaeobacter profundi]
MQAADDLALLIRAAQAAGDIALQYSGPTARRWEKPGGQGPVTEADLAVNTMLETMLRAARPDYGWLSEESEDSAARLEKERVFIIDPIDGTRSFAEGSATWAHSLAVAHHGDVTAAVIFLPQRDLLYTAAKGSGAFCNGQPIAVAPPSTLAMAKILTATPNLVGHHWRGGTAPDLQRSYRPSLAYRLARVAEGCYNAMLTLRQSWEWDIAAGDLILREAGGLTSNRLGAPLRFNNAVPLLDGVVAATPGIHHDLLQALDPAGPGIAGH